MSKSQDTSSARLLFQAFFIGLAACGFIVIAMDLLIRIPGLDWLLGSVAQAFFPEVKNGLGLLITSLVFLGIGYLPSFFQSRE